MSNENKLVTRDAWLAYMEIGSEHHLIGEGFTSFSESKNPKEYSRHYVHERSERTDTTGFSPSIAYSCDVYSGDPVVQKIVEITDREIIGTEAQVNIVSVNTWNNTAFRRKYSIIPDGKGDGTDALIYSGNFKAAGDNEAGTWDASSKKFTSSSTMSTQGVDEGATIIDGETEEPGTEDAGTEDAGTEE